MCSLSPNSLAVTIFVLPLGNESLLWRRLPWEGHRLFLLKIGTFPFWERSDTGPRLNPRGGRCVFAAQPRGNTGLPTSHLHLALYGTLFFEKIPGLIQVRKSKSVISLLAT